MYIYISLLNLEHISHRKLQCNLKFCRCNLMNTTTVICPYEHIATLGLYIYIENYFL